MIMVMEPKIQTLKVSVKRPPRPLQLPFKLIIIRGALVNMFPNSIKKKSYLSIGI